MARTQRHTRSTASKLAQHRSESGLSLREVMIRMVKTGLPESYVPSTEKLRRMEADLIPEPLFASGDFPVILECLARIYGVSLQELCPAAAEVMGFIRAGSSLAVSGTARSDLRDQTTGCLATSAA